jgi:primary-amine oxidase
MARGDAMLRREPGIIAALASRAITDLDQVMFDTWTYGYALIPEQYRGRRVVPPGTGHGADRPPSP